MCDIDVVKLRRVAFDFLASHDDLDLVSTRQLRTHCEKTLKFPADALNGVEEKEILAVIVQEYAATYQGRQSLKKAGEVSEGRKSAKFSKAESELIMKVVKEYLMRNNLIMMEVCAGMRDTTDKKRMHHTVWQEIASLLPHRTRASIKMHAERRMLHECTDHVGWTEQDKQELRALHVVHGNDWSSMGRTLGRPCSDCRAMYKKLESERTVKGHFSAEEDADLIEAVRKVLGFSKDHPIDKFPTYGIPWIEVRPLMHNKRTSLDYTRHWSVTKTLAIAALKKSKDEKKSSSSSSSSSSGIKNEDGDGSSEEGEEKKDARIVTLAPGKTSLISLAWLECLQKREADHKSEIIWARIDHELGLKYSESNTRWIRYTKHMSDGMTFPEKLDNLFRMYEKSGKKLKDYGSSASEDESKDQKSRKNTVPKKVTANGIKIPYDVKVVKEEAADSEDEDEETTKPTMMSTKKPVKEEPSKTYKNRAVVTVKKESKFSKKSTESESESEEEETPRKKVVEKMSVKAVNKPKVAAAKRVVSVKVKAEALDMDIDSDSSEELQTRVRKVDVKRESVKDERKSTEKIVEMEVIEIVDDDDSDDDEAVVVPSKAPSEARPSSVAKPKMLSTVKIEDSDSADSESEEEEEQKVKPASRVIKKEIAVRVNQSKEKALASGKKAVARDSDSDSGDEVQVEQPHSTFSTDSGSGFNDSQEDEEKKDLVPVKVEKKKPSVSKSKTSSASKSSEPRAVKVKKEAVKGKTAEVDANKVNTSMKKVHRSRNEELVVENVPSVPMSEETLLALEREYRGSARAMSEDHVEVRDEQVALSKHSKALMRREKEEEAKKAKRQAAFNELIAFQKSCAVIPAVREQKRAREAEEGERKRREAQEAREKEDEAKEREEFRVMEEQRKNGQEKARQRERDELGKLERKRERKERKEAENRRREEEEERGRLIEQERQNQREELARRKEMKERNDAEESMRQAEELARAERKRERRDKRAALEKKMEREKEEESRESAEREAAAFVNEQQQQRKKGEKRRREEEEMVVIKLEQIDEDSDSEAPSQHLLDKIARKADREERRDRKRKRKEAKEALRNLTPNR